MANGFKRRGFGGYAIRDSARILPSSCSPFVRPTRYPYLVVRIGSDTAYPTPRDREDASGRRDDLLLVTGGQRLAILRPPHTDANLYRESLVTATSEKY